MRGQFVNPESVIRGGSGGETTRADPVHSEPRQHTGGHNRSHKYVLIHSGRSVWLLVLILVFLILNPLLEKDQLGEAVLLLSMYATLISAIRALSERTRVRWPAAVLAVFSIVAMTVAHFYPLRTLVIVNWAILAAFFAVVSVGLFAYLGRAGAVTDDRIYVSVSLYLLLGMLWFSLYNMLESIHPGSFVQASTPTSALPRGTMIYLSLATLTTLGYGDIVPMTPIARMVAALEAVSGVLYIAITVARLVAGYRGPNQETG